MSRQLLSRTRIATCIHPSPGHTVVGDRATHVLLDPSGAIVHRYASEQYARASRALHNRTDACHTCLHGCMCELGQAGCGHWGCWGAAAEGSCTFTSAMRAAMQVQVQQ